MMPLNALFSLTVSVSDSAGAAVDGTLTFDATMPDHGHGMNVEPTVSSSATGEYLIEGINLHMPGTWKLDFISMLMVQLQTQRLITSVPKGRFNLTMRLIGSCLLALMLLCGCGAEPLPVESWTEEELGKIRSRIWDLSPPDDPTNRVAQDPRAQAFGELLYFSTLLSADQTVSCASCHDPALGLGDGQTTSTGLLQPTRRHAPHLWNIGYQRWFYWDGRRDSLWSQALSPIEDRNEMALDRLSLMRRIRNDEVLSPYYEELLVPILRFWMVHWRLRHRKKRQTHRLSGKKIGSFCQRMTEWRSTTRLQMSEKQSPLMK